jgi:hypothetical protein
MTAPAEEDLTDAAPRARGRPSDASLASSTEHFPSLTAYLESRGSLDVFRIRVTVEVAGE